MNKIDLLEKFKPDTVPSKLPKFATHETLPCNPSRKPKPNIPDAESHTSTPAVDLVANINTLATNPMYLDVSDVGNDSKINLNSPRAPANVNSSIWEKSYGRKKYETKGQRSTTTDLTREIGKEACLREPQTGL